MPEEILTPPVGTEPEAQPQIEPVEPEQTPAAEPEQPAVEPAPQPEPEKEQGTELPPLEERYRNQRSEALILNAQVKQKDELLNKLTSQDAPTEAELLSEYPDYNNFDPNSKRFVLDLLTTKKKQARIDRQLAEQEADRRWNSEIKALTKSEKYQTLKGDSGFEDFVFLPKHKGLDMTVLADAYLMRKGAIPTDEPKVQKREALPSGSGGRGPKRSNKISLEEATAIRKTDYKRYMELVKTGQIEEDF